MVATLLANGASRKWVRRLRKRLSTEMAATLQVLEDEEWEVFAVPAGGMFLWARPGVARPFTAAGVCAATRCVAVTGGAVQPHGRAQ